MECALGGASRDLPATGGWVNRATANRDALRRIAPPGATMTNAYHHIGEAWKGIDKSHGTPQWERLVAWRDGESFVKVEKPLRLNKARALGYKAKQGIIVVRARVRRGGLRKKRFVQGRVPSKMGVNKITMRQNTQARTARTSTTRSSSWTPTTRPSRRTRT